MPHRYSDRSIQKVVLVRPDGSGRYEIVTDNAGDGTVEVTNFPAVQPVSDNAGSLTVDTPQLPGALDADGGLKVHVQNPSTGGAATEFPAEYPLPSAQVTALMAPTSVSVSNLPSVQPVSDNGGSLTVDGAVSVSNFPATQPVSGTVAVSNHPSSISVSNLPSVQPVTDNGGSLTVDGTVGISGTVPVSGTFWQATQPVSGTVGINNFPASQAVTGTFWQATQPVVINDFRSATLMVTATGAAAAAVTLTLPAAGVGLFHYITSIEITLYNTAARTGTATPVLVTSTNIPGTPAFTFASAGAVGTTDRYFHNAVSPLKSSVANTATTVVAPATASVLWRMNVSYFTAA